MNLDIYSKTLSAMTVCVALPGCAGKTTIPTGSHGKCLPTFHFEAWRDAGPSNPSGKSDSGLKVGLGDQVLRRLDGKGIVIVADKFPIVTHPVLVRRKTSDR